MGVVVLIALALSYAGMIGAAVAAAPLPFLAFAAASYAASALLDLRYKKAAKWLQSELLMGHGMQFALRRLLVLVLVLRSGLPGWAVAWLLATYVALHGVRSAFAAVSAGVARRRRRSIAWRNLDLPSLELRPPPVAWLTRHGSRRIPYVDLLPLIGVALVEFAAPVAVIPVLSTLAVLVAVTFWLAMLLDRVRLLNRPDDAEVTRTVRDAVEALQPRVVAYFASGEGTEHLLNVWLGTYERLEESTVLFMREKVHLDRIQPTTLPIVVLPSAVDLESFRLPTLKVALYSTNARKNNQLIRVPGIKDLLILHGDSDKGSSFNPLSRLYDEVWVAGPAGRERYHRAGIGMRDDQIREVGRPQCAEIRAAGTSSLASTVPTVLYAPTWEGGDTTLEYSSLLTMGSRIVAGLLAMDPPVRVLFKPHPGTGDKVPAYAEAQAEVSDLITSADGEHQVVGGTAGLYHAFNAADIMITDISSVITDFLFLGKPYIVTNPRGDEDAEFKDAFPSTAGAYLLRPDCAGLADFVRDALTADSLAPQRADVAAHLLGDIEVDPVQQFNDAVSAVVAQQVADDAEASGSEVITLTSR